MISQRCFKSIDDYPSIFDWHGIEGLTTEYRDQTLLAGGSHRPFSGTFLGFRTSLYPPEILNIIRHIPPIPVKTTHTTTTSTPTAKFTVARENGLKLSYGRFRARKDSLSKSNQFKAPPSKSNCRAFHFCVRDKFASSRECSRTSINNWKRSYAILCRQGNLQHRTAAHVSARVTLCAFSDRGHSRMWAHASPIVRSPEVCRLPATGPLAFADRSRLISADQISSPAEHAELDRAQGTPLLKLMYLSCES